MDNILIKNGRILDPAQKNDIIGDVYIADGRIVEGDKTFKPSVILDASGCLVVPGLIDFHAHVFPAGTDIGIMPDLVSIPNGVTTVVDGGSAGSENFEDFYKTAIASSVVRIKAFLNLSRLGQHDMAHPESYVPDQCDAQALEQLFYKYENIIIGLKLKETIGHVDDTGLAPMKFAIDLAVDLGCKVNVHVVNPPCPMEQLAGLFRHGDIFTHVYHGVGNTILDETGHILPAIREARRRGVVFDAANGCNNFAFAVAEKALQDGFYPNIISSDLTTSTLYKQPVVSLPWVLSKYLAMGMKLIDVIAAATSEPAKQLGMEDEIGTLNVGACADVAIFKEETYMGEFLDVKGDKRQGNTVLLPQATIRGGTLVYRQLNF